MLFEATLRHNNMYSIEYMGANKNHHRFLKWAVMMNRTDHPLYDLKIRSGAFLQGEGHDWTLIEFWQPNHQAFVDWLNDNCEATISRMQELGLWLD